MCLWANQTKMSQRIKLIFQERCKGIVQRRLSLRGMCRVVKELPIKACRECVFSKGGHLFAAANSTTVSIYNTYTCENIANLR